MHIKQVWWIRRLNCALQPGFTLIELLVALAMASALIAGLGGVMGQVVATHDAVRDKNDLTQQASFAMQRMVQAVGNTRLLLLPLNDMPASNWPENIREQTVPPTPPVGESGSYFMLISRTWCVQYIPGLGPWHAVSWVRTAES